MNINILGAGTWGITLGYLLSKNNHDISIWLRDSSRSELLNNTHSDQTILDNIPQNIHFTSDINEIKSEYLTIIALPSHTINYVLSLKDFSDSNIVVASKGFDINTSLLISDLLVSMLNIDLNKIAIISGPNHAEEILLDKPTATVVASKNSQFNKDLQSLFNSINFRVYRSNDIIGVQLGGSVKNVIAIAAGMCSGLELGDNIKATLVARGMNELISLSSIFDMKIKTLYGLSGLGDLLATSYSKHSRNWQLGYNIAKGFTLDESINNVDMVCEGINTCKILNNISSNNNIEMPICNEVYNILFNNSNPKESIYRLMSRELKKENK